MKKNIFTQNGRLLLIFIIAIAENFVGNAQFAMDVMPNAKPMDPAVIIYGGSNINGGIPYDKIKGSPFWNDEYQLAALYGPNGEKWLYKTKLNLTNNEVYFITPNNNEMIAPEALVTKIQFFQLGDTSKTVAVFRFDYGEKKVITGYKDYYIQVLNEGDVQLLKLNTKPVASADSFHIAKRYYFDDNIKYFLQNKSQTIALRKLSEENVLSHLPGANNCKNWIAQQKINFKKEEDVVRFIDYYNSVKQP